MVHRLISKLALLLVAGLVGVVALSATACGDYDPPPDLTGVNLTRGTYDPARGDIVLTLSEPVDTSTLKVQVAQARFSEERDLCLPKKNLPAGCELAANIAIDTDSDLITIEDDRIIRIDGSGLALFNSYVVRIRGGLTDKAGNIRVPDLLTPFFTQGDVQGTATTFEGGAFFGRLSITKPIPLNVSIFFWIEVSLAQEGPKKGLIKLFGADADPAKGGVDSGEESLKADKWIADPNPPLGFTVIANGLIQESESETVVQLLPFNLQVTTPEVLASGAEFLGTFSEQDAPGDVGGRRDVIVGQLTAESVHLGDNEVSMGDAQGELLMYRLTAEEAPPLSAFLADGTIEQDVRSTFED